MEDAPDAFESPLLEGVHAFDHTADVGVVVYAPNLATLFVRAARGLDVLIAGEGHRWAGVERAMAGAERTTPAGNPDAEDVAVELEAPDVAILLADWLRELLYHRQVRGLAFAGASFTELSETRLVARVAMVPARAHAVREIKGVTYHGLSAERSSSGWRARIIFDV